MGDNEPGNLLYVIAIDKQLTKPEIRYVLDLSGDISLDASNNNNTITGILNKWYKITANDSVSNVSSTQPDTITVNAERIIILPTNSSPINTDLNGYVVNSSIKITYDISGASVKIAAADDKKSPFTKTSVVDLTYKGLSQKIDEVLFTSLDASLNVLRDDIAKYYKYQSGGGKTLSYTQTGGNNDYKITKTTDASFNTIITLYIKTVNELLNVPMFKKILSLTSSEIATILPMDNKDDMIEQLKSVITVDVDFSKFNENTKDNQQIRNFLSGADAEKGNIASVNNNSPTITLSEFANRFLYQIQKANYDYQTLSNTIKTIPEFMNFVVDIVSKQTTQIRKFIDGNFLPTISNNQVVQKAINKAIRAKMKTNILTFLKIRNDDGDIYNRRFDIKLNSSGVPKIMQLKYNDDNLPYYREDKAKFIPIAPIPNFNNSKNSTTLYTIPTTLDISLNKPYDREYLFGEFTQIFPPKMSNADIAKQMDIITEQLTAPEPKPVFILGYGASGAGKTSSLIYFNKGKTPDEQNGILIQLCNQLGASGKYEDIELEYREMYDSGEGKNFTENPMYTDCSAVSFHYTDPEFKLQAEYTHQNHHTYRISKELGNECDISSNKTTKFNAGTPIGEIMIHLIDKDRHVKATTNNPNSSRSHSLIFVKLTKTSDPPSKPAYLIVGDFAGVENVFDCENPAVLTDFMNIKEDKKGSNRLFYEVEKCGIVLDPIGSTKSSCNNQTGGEPDDAIGNNSPTSLPIYDFENPALTEEFKKAYPILKRFSNKDDLKKAIIFVRSSVGITAEKDVKLVKTIDALDIFYDPNKLTEYKESYNKLIKFRGDIQPYITTRDIYQSEKEAYNQKLQEYNATIAKLEKAAKATTSGTVRPFGMPSALERDIKDRFTPEEKTILIQYVESNNIYNEINPKNNTTIYPLLHAAFNPPVADDKYAKSMKKICDVYKEKFSEISTVRKLIHETFGKKSYTLSDNCVGDETIDKLVPELASNVKKILKIIFADDSGFYNFVKMMDYDRTTRLALSEIVCVNRRTEGTFINDSLRQVRNVLREMLYEKNKDALAIVPNYIDICFDQYCPTHENCFSFNSPKSQPASDIPSVIFTQIYEYLKKDINDTTFTKEAMYKDLLVCVFCVFNISKKANNPPPVPYVDVNELKRIVYNYDIFEEDHANTFVEHAKTLIEAIESDYKYRTESGSDKNRLEALKTVPIGVVEKQSPVYQSLKDNDEKFLSSKTAYELFVFLKTQFENRPGGASPELGGQPKQEGGAIDPNLDQLLDLELLRLNAVLIHNKNDEQKKQPANEDYLNAKDAFQNAYNFVFNHRLGDIQFNTMKDNLHRLLKAQKVDIPAKLNDSNAVQHRIKYLNGLKQEIADKANADKDKAEKEAKDKAEKKAKEANEANEAKEKEAKAKMRDIIQTNWATMQTPGIKPIIKEYIIDFIEAVDNSNAVSAVGTLEFIDRLSKLNAVATICNAEESTLTPFTNKLAMKDVLSTQLTKQVVEKKKIGGTRRTGKRVAKRTKKRRPVSI